MTEDLASFMRLDLALSEEDKQWEEELLERIIYAFSKIVEVTFGCLCESNVTHISCCRNFQE